MTAEVGVMNRLAVALAADSAVTLGRGPKVYGSAEKLFQLSTIHPVGAMFFGNADLLGIPVESVVKVFRGALGRTEFDTLEGYRDFFLEFVRDDKAFFGEDCQERYLSSTLIAYYHHLLANRVLPSIKDRLETDKLTEAEIKNSIREVVVTEHHSVSAAPFLAGYSDQDAAAVAKKYRQPIESAIKEVFERLPLSAESLQKLVWLGSQVFFRDSFGGSQTGVVIAGFGSSEIFPALTETAFRGKLLGKLISRNEKTRRIQGATGAIIVPFAQKEMVRTFMEGVDPELRAYLARSANDVVDGLFELLVQELAPDEKSANRRKKSLRPHLESLKAKLFENWRNLSVERYVDPIMTIVGSLPKDELAAMAETFIGMTKFKRRISRDLETVGGPVDVALITKGDGFVWVKRKHYFDPGLNPRFFGRFVGEALQ